ncbi:MAG TPA: hypothetical protein VGK19_24480 [Capsulimonadaceae bacterium]
MTYEWKTTSVTWADYDNPSITSTTLGENGITWSQGEAGATCTTNFSVPGTYTVTASCTATLRDSRTGEAIAVFDGEGSGTVGGLQARASGAGASTTTKATVKPLYFVIDSPTGPPSPVVSAGTMSGIRAATNFKVPVSISVMCSNKTSISAWLHLVRGTMGSVGPADYKIKARSTSTVPKGAPRQITRTFEALWDVTQDIGTYNLSVTTANPKDKSSTVQFHVAKREQIDKTATSWIGAPQGTMFCHKFAAGVYGRLGLSVASSAGRNSLWSSLAECGAKQGSLEFYRLFKEPPTTWHYGHVGIVAGSDTVDVNCKAATWKVDSGPIHTWKNQ